MENLLLAVLALAVVLPYLARPKTWVILLLGSLALYWVRWLFS